MSIWIKNTDGKRDSMLTLALAGFVVVLVKLALSGVHLELGKINLLFGSIDGTAIAAILTPTLGAYVARRYTDRKIQLRDSSKEGGNGNI